jgi:hypothetical protein
MSIESNLRIQQYKKQFESLADQLRNADSFNQRAQIFEAYYGGRVANSVTSSNSLSKGETKGGLQIQSFVVIVNGEATNVDFVTGT